MTQHTLLNRTESDTLWFERRGFLQAAAAWTAMGGFAAAQAQARSNVVQQVGDALVNGSRLLGGQTIQTGDRVETGPGASLVFVMGNSSFQVRQNSNMTVERGSTLNAVSVLRLLTGAVASVWARGNNRQINTPTLTIGIRGTGVYTEVFPDQNNRSYFCNCYGTVALNAGGGDSAISQADYHQSFWGEAEPKDGRYLRPAAAINHTDAELEFLAGLMNQRTTWQVMGKKGKKDGMGYMDGDAARPHPAMMIGK
jgi:hypothetical protein